MVHCSNCNFELPENAKFCPNCGTPYTPEVRLSSDAPESAKGRTLCGKCGLELPEGAKFCTVCGGKAVSDTSIIAPTSGIIGGAAAAAVTASDNSMQSLSLDAKPEMPEPLFGSSVSGAVSVPEVGSIPEIPEVGEIPELAEVPVIGENPVIGETPLFGSPASSVPEPVNPVVGETPLFGSSVSSVPEPVNPVIGASPLFGSSATATATAAPVSPVIPPVSPLINEPVSPAAPVSAAPQSASSFAQPVNTVPQAANTYAQPVNTIPQPTAGYAQPVNGISQPISAGQPISASSIIPPVSLNDGSVAGTPVSLGKNTTPTAGFAAPTAPIAQTQPKPKKKIKAGAVIGIAAGSLVAVVAIVAGVLFTTNKAMFLSTILGKEKYAVMVESEAIKQTASKIDSTAISEGVEAVSGMYAAFAALDNNDNPYDVVGDIVDMSNENSGMSPTKAQMVNAATGPTSGVEGFDLGAYVKMLNEQYVKMYGVNALNAKMSANVEFGNAIKELAGDVPVEDIQSLINDSGFTYSVIAAENAAQVGFDIKLDDETNLDCNVIMTADGEFYMVMPFVSDKAILMKIDAPTQTAETTDYQPLSLDKAELDRIITAIAECYLMNYKEAAIEMENGSVTVAGVDVEGKEITAEFKGKALKKLFTDIAEIIAKDEYLSGKVVEFVQQFDEDFTKEDYENGILDDIDFEAENSDKLIITTIIDKNGNILAKTFKAVDDDSEATMGYTVSKETVAFEISAPDDGFELTAKTDLTSTNSGSTAIKVTYEEITMENGEEVSEKRTLKFSLEFNNVGIEKFCGKSTPVGSLTISAVLPDEFEDQLGAEALAAINGASITLSQTVSGERTADAFVRLEVNNYGSLALNYSVEAYNGEVSEFPTDVIDITSAIKAGMPDEATEKALIEYFDEVGKAYENLRPFFEKYENLFGEMPEYENPLKPQGGSDRPGSELLSVEEMKTFVQQDVQMLAQLMQNAPTDDKEMKARITTLVEKYSGLYGELVDLSEDGEDYANRLLSLNKLYEELYDELLTIEYDLEEINSAVKLPSVNVNEISKMDYVQLGEIMDAYNAVFERIKQDEATIVADAKLKELFDKADYAYMDVEHDFSYFNDTLKRGNLNINLLNTWRSSMKEYVPAVNELVAVLEARGML